VGPTHSISGRGRVRRSRLAGDRYLRWQAAMPDPTRPHPTSDARYDSEHVSIGFTRQRGYTVAYEKTDAFNIKDLNPNAYHLGTHTSELQA